jgi:uncharacterized membrane protein YccC
VKPASAVNVLALRGAVAAAIAVSITTVLSLERPYWVIMIAVVLVNQTTGQSLRRSGERVAATVAGFAIGWGLEWITSAHHPVQAAIMTAAVFLAVFFRQSWGRGSYPWMMLFISLYVVFLFALLGEWSPAIFAARIYDTFLGAGAALAATFVVASPGSKEKLHREAEEWWKQCRTELVAAVERFTSGGPVVQKTHANFLRQLDTLRDHTGEALYETFLRRTARREALAALAVTEMLCYLALGLIDAMACAPESFARERLGNQLRELVGPLANAPLGDFAGPSDDETGTTPTRPNACRLATELCRAAGISGAELAWAMPTLYYAAALAESRKTTA